MTKYPELPHLYSKKVFKELKKRIFFVIFSLVIFRIGSFIPIPGINTSVIEKIFEQQKHTIIGMFNMFSGGALSRASVFALGIVPYISSSIIIQLLTIIYPKFSELKKEGEMGKQKINRYTRYGTLILSVLQSIGVSTGLPNIPGMEGLVINPNFSFYFVSVLSLVCGTMFLMWLGEQITEKGIGNGISIIIFSGIVSGLPAAVGSTLERSRQGDLHIISFLMLLLFMFAVTYFVVFIERGQRRIVVNYAYRQQGRKIFSTTQSTHLPLKINMSGVMPAIFSSSLILFPATISSWFGGSTSWNWMVKISFYLQPGKILYTILYTVSVIFFCFFYTSIVFNPKETADNLKKSGAFVPGIRPGEQTARYIGKVMHRLTLFGSVYIVFICLIPEFMRNIVKAPFYFGGTSLLIVVVVIMDFIAQIQTLLMTSQYESTLKKVHLKKM